MPSRKKVIDTKLQTFHLELLKSVRQMKSGKAVRKTGVAVHKEVAASHARVLGKLKPG